MKKCAYPIDRWGIQDEPSGKERKKCNVVIGYIANEKNETVDYITEPFFLDIFTDITDNKKAFSVYTNIQQVPPVVIKYDNDVLLHNHEMQVHQSNIKAILDTIQLDMLMQSLVESRIMKLERKKGNAMKAVESMVRATSGVNYNATLIMYMVQQLYTDTNEDKTGIKETFKMLEEKDIIRFMGAVKEYEFEQITSNKHLSVFLDKYSIEEIEAAVNQEIADRYFLGLI